MAVCSILYQLSTRQAEQQKVHEELLKVLPDPNTPLTPQLLDQMHYLKAFIREVFRLVNFKTFNVFVALMVVVKMKREARKFCAFMRH